VIRSAGYDSEMTSRVWRADGARLRRRPVKDPRPAPPPVEPPRRKRRSPVEDPDTDEPPVTPPDDGGAPVKEPPRRRR